MNEMTSKYWINLDPISTAQRQQWLTAVQCEGPVKAFHLYSLHLIFGSHGGRPSLCFNTFCSFHSLLSCCLSPMVSFFFPIIHRLRSPYIPLSPKLFSFFPFFFIYNRRRVYSQAQLLSQLPAPHKLKKSHRGNSPLSTTEQVAGFKASSSSTDLPESHSSGNAPPTKLHAQPELLSAKPAFHATSELSVSGAAEEIETA